MKKKTNEIIQTYLLLLLLILMIVVVFKQYQFYKLQKSELDDRLHSLKIENSRIINHILVDENSEYIIPVFNELRQINDTQIKCSDTVQCFEVIQ